MGRRKLIPSANHDGEGFFRRGSDRRFGLEG